MQLAPGRELRNWRARSSSDITCWLALRERPSQRVVSGILTEGRERAREGAHSIRTGKRARLEIEPHLPRARRRPEQRRRRYDAVAGGESVLAQASLKRSRSSCAQEPVPRMRSPKALEYSLPPWVSRISDITCAARSGMWVSSHWRNRSATSSGRRSQHIAGLARRRPRRHARVFPPARCRSPRGSAVPPAPPPATPAARSSRIAASRASDAAERGSSLRFRSWSKVVMLYTTLTRPSCASGASRSRSRNTSVLRVVIITGWRVSASTSSTERVMRSCFSTAGRDRCWSPA